MSTIPASLAANLAKQSSRSYIFNLRQSPFQTIENDKNGNCLESDSVHQLDQPNGEQAQGTFRLTGLLGC